MNLAIFRSLLVLLRQDKRLFIFKGKASTPVYAYIEDGKLELYNTADDISERENLAPTMPDKVNEMHNVLLQWRKDVQAPVPTTTTPAPPPAPAEKQQWEMETRSSAVIPEWIAKTNIAAQE